MEDFWMHILHVAETMTQDFWMRITENIADRVTGPLKFRFLLQPLTASIFATLSGLKDARMGNPPYFWTLLNDPVQRTDMLKGGWKDVGKVFVFALLLDVGYQIYVLHFVYPGEAIIVAIVLAIIPYLIMRGLITRIARKK